MGSSFKLFTVRDIDIKIHITFPLILVWAGIQYGAQTGSLESALFGVIGFAFLFVLVTLHELGHSFTAQHFGVTVKQIVLTPLGGVAQLAEIPENPVQEFIIAIAGPAVNVAIAIIMGLVALVSGISIGNPLLAISGMAGLSLGSLFGFVFIYNIILAVFNLIPAFPLDGGRIFRSLLAIRMEYSRATAIAAIVGQAVAVLLGLFGLLNGAIFTIFIAVFIFAAARHEARLVQVRSLLRGVKVRQVFSSSGYVLQPESTVQQATNMMILGGQRNFAVVQGENLVGFLPFSGLTAAMRTAAPHTFIANVMRRDIDPVEPNDDLFEVQRQMEASRLEALPVAEEGRFLGIIDRRQIANARHVMRVAPKAMPQSQSV
jgi:Zn-dependent protease/CBS domain-containing protein